MPDAIGASVHCADTSSAPSHEPERRHLGLEQPPVLGDDEGEDLVGLADRSQPARQLVEDLDTTALAVGLLVQAGVLHGDGRLVGEHRQQLELLGVEDLAGEFLTDQEDAAQRLLRLQPNHQRGPDLARGGPGWLEVAGQAVVEAGLLGDQDAAVLGEPLYERAGRGDHAHAGDVPGHRLLPGASRTHRWRDRG